MFPRDVRSLMTFPAVATVLACGVAYAAWPTTPLGNVVVGTPGTDIYEPFSCSDGAGGMIITWRTDRPESDIYAQRIRADGTVAWDLSGVLICGAPDNQEQPKIAPDDNGGAIITWWDDRAFPSRIYAQHVDSLGNTLWTADGVLLSSTHSGITPEITPDGAGGAIIAWRSGDIFAQRINAAGSVLWAQDALLCGAAGSQWQVQVAPDDAGGAVVIWMDNGRGGALYAQRVSPTGQPLWATDGVSVSDTTGVHVQHVIIRDGYGGAYVAWANNTYVLVQRMSATGQPLWASGGIPVSALGCGQLPQLALSGDSLIAVWSDCRGGDADIYAQSFDSAGTAHWTPNGVPVCTVAGYQRYADVAGDGQGGAVIAWHDERVADRNLYAQRVDESGARQWAVDGVEVSMAAYSQEIPRVLSDGRSGMLIRWHDARTATWQVAAQRVNRDGVLAGEEPVIESLTDVPADQGGRLLLEFAASYLDVPPNNEIGSYAVLKRIDEQLNWAVVDSVVAVAMPTYSLNVSAQTSTPSTPRYSTYAVVAQRMDGTQSWISLPDSAAALDNLPPEMPVLIEATAFGDSVMLRWASNMEEDLDRYRVFAGDSIEFEISDSTLIQETTDTTLVASGLQATVFKITARDIHENDSEPALAIPGEVANVLAPSVSSLVRPSLTVSPNPLVFGCQFIVDLSGPTETELLIYDAQGRRIRSFGKRRLRAGTYVLDWDGRGTNGHLAPGGRYWARLVTKHGTVVRPLALLR